MFYDRTRDIQDRLRRTIILLQANDARIGKVLLKVQNIGNVGATPFVDRLILVTHHANVLLFLRQKTNQGKL